MTDDGLYIPLHDGDPALIPPTEAHRKGLRAACAQDEAIWAIYPASYQGAAFDPQFDRLLAGGAQRRVYAITQGDSVVGMTAWIDHAQPGWSTEVGNTFIALEPDAMRKKRIRL